MAFGSSIKKFFARQTTDPTWINGPRRPFFNFGQTIVDENTAMQVAAFNRGVVYISTQIAKLPWDIKDENHVIVKPNKVSSLLNLQANPEMNAFRFRLFMVQSAIIHGNAYAEIERNTIGQPIALWPLFSEGMQIIRDPEGNLLYHYNPNWGSGKSVYLQPSDVIHISNFHTRDGIVGQGVVAYGREVLGIHISADIMAGGLFRNGGIPSGILTSPGRLSDEAYSRLKTSWAEQQGGRKSGSTSILEEGITYTPVNVNPEALQFIQSRQFGVLEIARFLGLPPTKLFDVVAAKYANVENANLEVATDTLDAWATSFELEADIKILNSRYGGRYTDIDLYSIFRGDMVTRANYFKTMISIGAMTPNQIRDRENLPGYKDGDSYYIASNNLTPIDRLDEVIDADIEQKTKPAPTPMAPAAPGKNPKKEDPNGDDPEDTASKKALEDAAIQFLRRK